MLSIGLGGCLAPSAGSAAASAAQPPTLDVATLDPCSLVAHDALVAQLGQRVSAGVAVDDPAAGTATCRYSLLSDLASISVVVYRTPASGVRGEEVIESLGPLPGLEELHGVGDVAWFGYCPACPVGSTTTLTVIAAPLHFSIAFDGAAPPVSERVHAEALARHIVEELGL